MRLAPFALVVTVGTGFAPAAPRADVTPPKPAAARLPSGSVPRVLLDEWRKAENGDRCAPLWLDDLGTLAGAKLRRASVAGGWAVEFDKPDLRSHDPVDTECAGIAGMGPAFSEGNEHELTPWKLHRQIPGGIRAGYDGTLDASFGWFWYAYVIVPGQVCYYSVWSRVGREQLEFLLDHLRVVDVSSMLRP